MMDKGEAINIAKEFILSIHSKFKVENAILFGSFAKGTQNNCSDIDIAIVLDSNTDIIDAQIELMILRRKINLPLEPHPFNRDDFNESNPLASEILKHGVNLV